MAMKQIWANSLLTAALGMLTGCSMDQEEFQRNLKNFEKALHEEFQMDDSELQWKAVDIDGKDYRRMAEPSSPGMGETDLGIMSESGNQPEPEEEFQQQETPLQGMAPDAMEELGQEGELEEDEQTPQRGARIF